MNDAPLFAGFVQGEGQLLPEANGGAIPTTPLHYRFKVCCLDDVAVFVKKHHYSKSHPGGVDYCFCVIGPNGGVCGAAIYGHIAGNPMAACVLSHSLKPDDYRELMRLVLLDFVPKNTESRFIAFTLRWLKRHTNLLAIVSFADPKYGHRGIVYQASNWIYTGLQKQDRDRLIINGTETHPKSAFNLYGTSSLTKLREKGLTVETKEREPKHRYVYILRDGLECTLRYRKQQYPGSG